MNRTQLKSWSQQHAGAWLQHMLSVSSAGSEENVQHLLIMLATAAVVTGARLALLSSWPAFAEASDRSNQQVCVNVSVH